MTDDAGHLAGAGPWSGPRLDRLADSFGNPVRRDVFMLLRTRGAPMVATEVARRLGLQRTAARAHLERLVDLGLVSTATRPTASGGRPTKSYAVGESRLEISEPPRRYEALAGSLLELLMAAGVEEPAEHAAAVGRTFGERTAEEIVGAGIQRPVRLSLPALVKWMNESGYAATVSPVGRGSGSDRDRQLRLPGARAAATRRRVRLRLRHALRHARRGRLRAPADSRPVRRRPLLSPRSRPPGVTSRPAGRRHARRRLNIQIYFTFR